MSETKFVVGQKWKRRDGVVVTVEEISDEVESCVAMYASYNFYCANGMYYSTGTEDDRDLVELVEDVPQPVTIEEHTHTAPVTQQDTSAADAVARQQDNETGAKTAPQADADGWIAHNGVGCPVSGDTIVTVRHHDGEEYTLHANQQSWTHDSPAVGGDIVAYRIHKPSAEAIADGMLADAVGLAQPGETGIVCSIEAIDMSSIRREQFVDALILQMAPALAESHGAYEIENLLERLVAKRDELLAPKAE
ncbi:hypothetical protein AB7813_08300 [Tardiphaga sp. 20_F10_N6_6]|uniref:hypothetical protein n=1 Tax=Tardiphaga sp. 20_F10_N6_6 TaxID=3240788 RepID=UPI003F8C410C